MTTKTTTNHPHQHHWLLVVVAWLWLWLECKTHSPFIQYVNAKQVLSHHYPNPHKMIMMMTMMRHEDDDTSHHHHRRRRRLIQACPSDPTLYGYTSLDDLNHDMQQDIAAVAAAATTSGNSESNIQPQGTQGQQQGTSTTSTTTATKQYLYTLCPQTIFTRNTNTNTNTNTDNDANTNTNDNDTNDIGVNAEEPLLTPVLDGTIIRCGKDGNSKNQCIVSGGLIQVLFLDTSNTTTTTTSSSISTSTTSNNENNLSPSSTISTTMIVMEGITFEKSQDYSIAAMASSTTHAIFLDCHWNECTGSGCIYLSKALSPLAMTSTSVSSPSITTTTTTTTSSSTSTSTSTSSNVFDSMVQKESSRSGDSDSSTSSSTTINPAADGEDTSSIVTDSSSNTVETLLYQDAGRKHDTTEDSTFTTTNSNTNTDTDTDTTNDNTKNNKDSNLAMTLTLQHCTFKNSGKETSSSSSSSLVVSTVTTSTTTTNKPFRSTIWNRKGILELYDVLFNDLGGMFVLNILGHGSKLTMDSCRLTNNDPITTALIRGIDHAHLEIYNSILDQNKAPPPPLQQQQQQEGDDDTTDNDNDPLSSSSSSSSIISSPYLHPATMKTSSMVATVAILEQSTLVMESTMLEDNDPLFSDLIVFANSRATIHNACWKNHGIIVDSTSWLEQEYNYMELQQENDPTSTTSTSTSTTPQKCEERGILQLESHWECLTTQFFCAGDCLSMNDMECSLQVLVNENTTIGLQVQTTNDQSSSSSSSSSQQQQQSSSSGTSTITTGSIVSFVFLLL